MTVPLTNKATADRQRQDLDRLWEREDDAGSADAAYARGLLRFQLGDRDAARVCLDRADQRGSAEAAYLVGLLHMQGGDQRAAMDAVQRADGRGSVLAPLTLAAFARQASDETTERRAMDTALQRAKAADKAGSADGAFVTAAVTAERGALQESIAAARRADERGSANGSFLLAQLNYHLGELHEAYRTAKRAAQRGLPVEGLLFAIGESFQQRHKYHRARRAWTLASAVALQQGDTSTYEAALTRLHPGIRYWLHTHIRGITIFLALVVVLVVLGQWRWLAAAAAWALIPILTWIIPHPGMLIARNYDPPVLQGLSAVSTGKLTVAVGMVDEDAAVEPPPETRPTITRDYYFLPLAPVLLVIIAVILTVWAVGGLDSAAMLRAFYGWAALSLVWYIAWRAPDMLNRAPPAEDTTGSKNAVKIVLLGSFTKGLGGQLAIIVGEPRIREIYNLVRANSVEDGPVTLVLLRAQPWLNLLGIVSLVAFLAVEAFIPNLKDLSAGLGAIVATAIVIAAVVVTALVAITRSACGLYYRTWGTLFTGIGSLLAVAVVVAVAYWTGLLGDWVNLWNSLVSPH
jgi:tetratricopeptide (TPR) repeat protein